MSRTFRRAFPIPSECSGARCTRDACQRCMQDVHFGVNGRRSDKFAGHDGRECPEARRTQGRQHRRRIARNVRNIARNVEAWESDSLVTFYARRTSGWLTH